MATTQPKYVVENEVSFVHQVWNELFVITHQLCQAVILAQLYNVYVHNYREMKQRACVLLVEKYASIFKLHRS